jgi:hypothetical protein
MSKEKDDYGREYERDELSHDYKHGSLTGGLALISLGVALLIATFIPSVQVWNLWPVVIFAVGVGIVVSIVYKIQNKRK